MIDAISQVISAVASSVMGILVAGVIAFYLAKIAARMFKE